MHLFVFQIYQVQEAFMPPSGGFFIQVDNVEASMIMVSLVPVIWFAKPPFGGGGGGH